ncbi:B-cell receptor CD22-like isoform X2 [Xiphophorus maculatus]|uniref:B-cell receptor CD22-like isoform X2 n=1 Tax=Xiphophorus maculatus TaxID=8083 RepID=UPI000C6EC535|nr:B-cell receptor CD22-like isoform X2 [Xiphophorus maculatus]
MGNTWLYVLFLFSSVISGYAKGHREANGIKRHSGYQGPYNLRQPGSPEGTGKSVPNRANVTLTPNWPLIYKGERVTLHCEIPGGEGTKWTYEWRRTRLNETQTSQDRRLTIHSANESDSGGYSCRGTSRDGSTDWSDVVVLTVYQLSVSPSWLSPGASVTLICEVEHPPAGTRFFWYKAVYDPSIRSYSYELLPGSSDGTDENFYIVHGLTSTAGYACEAGNGKPKYRDPSFVWSADPCPAASLSVNPDRVQHFISDFVSLSCEGNSTEWRLMRFTEKGHLSDCSIWGKMTGSICTIKIYFSVSGVFWCESGSGEFSNAVNVTVHDSFFFNTILVSPVHPVTEGDPVTLNCKHKTQQFPSKVFFYHNDKLIHNDGREELNISAVSKSDEGFYKCKHSGKESPRSWMSVRATVSSPVMLIVGPVVGIVLIILIILLILLWRRRRSKGLWCIRSKQSEGRGQTSHPDHGVNNTDGHENSSPPHDNTNLYVPVKSSETTGNAADEARDVTYSHIELKDIDRTRRPREADESTVYSEVKLQE